LLIRFVTSVPTRFVELRNAQALHHELSTGGGAGFWRDGLGRGGTIRDFNHLQLRRSMLDARCWMLELKTSVFSLPVPIFFPDSCNQVQQAATSCNQVQQAATSCNTTPPRRGDVRSNFFPDS